MQHTLSFHIMHLCIDFVNLSSTPFVLLSASLHFSENKLEKLKSKRKGKDIVQSLEERNKSSMMNFLSNENQSVLGDEDFILDTPVSNNHPIMRYVAPDKQALTLGELVELLKADHLSHVIEQQQESEEEKKLPETPN